MLPLTNHKHPIAPNMLQRNFTATQINQAWVADITYIPTGQGWLYLAVVKDLCSKIVVGYAFSQWIDIAFTLGALHGLQATEAGKRTHIHSDRGVQYAATAYREQLRRFRITQSMGRKGDPYDNAVAENFFSCFKCELVHLACFGSRQWAHNAIFTYIEGVYNSFRSQSGID